MVVPFGGLLALVGLNFLVGLGEVNDGGACFCHRWHEAGLGVVCPFDYLAGDTPSCIRSVDFVTSLCMNAEASGGGA